MKSGNVLRCLVAFLCALGTAMPIAVRAQSADPEPTWFAIMGNLIEADADTVELDVANIHTRGQIKSMDLRVNLAHQRTMESGEKYTSYKSVIEIDCERDGVFHVEQTRYVGPRWTGDPTTQYFANSRPMAFRGLVPSPKPRVLKAACSPP